MYKFRIYYIEIIVNIIAAIMFLFLLWITLTKTDVNVLKNMLGGNVNAYKISMYVIAFLSLSIFICSVFFFFFHFFRLLNLKEKKILFKRSFITAFWIFLFLLNIALAFYIKSSHTKFFPIVNGISITGYTFVISMLLTSYYYLRLSKNEILYFKQKKISNKTLVDELHEN